MDSSTQQHSYSAKLVVVNSLAASGATIVAAPAAHARTSATRPHDLADVDSLGASVVGSFVLPYPPFSNVMTAVVLTQAYVS
mmetsp:Transcript_36747/g.113688  ORF Transcript_36747/g.113688 Transcript_36747/m.113688 type:complete len:82 (+) Transcript_36747:383-628(+)